MVVDSDARAEIREAERLIAWLDQVKEEVGGDPVDSGSAAKRAAAASKSGSAARAANEAKEAKQTNAEEAAEAKEATAASSSGTAANAASGAKEAAISCASAFAGDTSKMFGGGLNARVAQVVQVVRQHLLARRERRADVIHTGVYLTEPLKNVYNREHCAHTTVGTFCGPGGSNATQVIDTLIRYPPHKKT